MSTKEAPPSLEELAVLESLFVRMDKYFSESGERRRFMHSANGLAEDDLYLLQTVLKGKLTAEAALAGAAAAQSPLRLANALLELETTVKKSKDRVLLDFIFALLQSKKVPKGLSRVWFFPWELALVLNKNLTAEQVRFIWLNKKDDYAKELVPSSIRVLVKHPNCPPDVLEELLLCDDAIVRRIIAMHPKTSAKITHFFLNSQRKPERLNVAMSRHASSDVLLSLLQDKYDEISRAAKKNLAKRFPEQEISDAIIKAAIEKNIVKPFVKPAIPKIPFDPWAAASSGHESVLALESAQRMLATLARDSDHETSNNALKTLSKLSPAVIAEELLDADVLDTAYRTIASLVAKNDPTSDHEERFRAQEQLVIDRAMLVAAHTTNPMIQLMIVKDVEEIPPYSTVRWDLLSALTGNRHLSETVCRKIVVVLKFGGFDPIQHCNSPALLREFLEPGVLTPHYHSTVKTRLIELTTSKLERGGN